MSIMLTNEDKAAMERSYQIHTAVAFIGLCLIVGSFVFAAFLTVHYIRTNQSIFDLASPVDPLGLLLFGVIVFLGSRRKLKKIADIQKSEEPNQPPDPIR